MYYSAIHYRHPTIDDDNDTNDLTFAGGQHNKYVAHGKCLKLDCVVRSPTRLDKSLFHRDCMASEIAYAAIMRENWDTGAKPLARGCGAKLWLQHTNAYEDRVTVNNDILR